MDIQFSNRNRLEGQRSPDVGTPILVYHRIIQDNAPKDSPGNAVRVTQFERQMHYLHDHGYRCLSLSELLQPFGEKGIPRRTRALALTFDDGYGGFFTLAYPILRHYGFTATVFLVTDRIGEQSHWEGARGVHLLTWEEIGVLHESGIHFGSHTCTHRHLALLSSEQIRHELTASKERLEARLGQEVPFLAYPYGESNPEIRNMARQAGYKAAFGVITGESGHYNLWRRPCGSRDTPLTFAFKLSHWCGYVIWLRRWLREATRMGQFLRRVKHGWFPHGESSIQRLSVPRGLRKLDDKRSQDGR